MRAPVAILALPLLLASAVHRPYPEDEPATIDTSPCAHLPAVRAPRASANDNRVAAGVQSGDTLSVTLVAGPAAWYPEAESGCGVPTLAFAEAGKQPSIPGPLIRVRAGATLRISVRNAAGRTLWLRGFQDRPSDSLRTVELAPDSVRDFRFTVTTPGTYAYGATLSPFPAGGKVVQSAGDGSQLVGGFVVDPADAPPEPRDRVLILTRWAVRPPGAGTGQNLFAITAVNGKSWPHTELLTHAEGDSVHWRVINGSAAPHPMHLHGFYFRVDAKGTFTRDTVLARPRTVVTEVLFVGQSMKMSWLAERPGNWLFHCHLLIHMTAEQRLDRVSDSASAFLGVRVPARPRGDAAHAIPASQATHANHATDGMAGLIVGIRVQPAPAGATRDVRDGPPRRLLRLFVNRRPAVFEGGAPGYGFVLQEGAREPARDSLLRPGSPILLRRGEPVQITVFNRLSTPLSVHWHGLELDSYFDGVGGWSGSTGSIAPPVAPSDSFVVRLTPPRAGTFMYHVHGEEGRELSSGLYAPLIVLDDATALDTLTDKLLLVSDGGPRREDGAFVNGSRSPRITLTAGRTHRLRLIGITGDFPADLTILQGVDTVRWRLLARDGAELTGDAEPLTAAHRRIGPGIIADYELTPAVPGELTLRVTSGTLALKRADPSYFEKTWTVPITVVAPDPLLGARPPAAAAGP